MSATEITLKKQLLARAALLFSVLFCVDVSNAAPDPVPLVEHGVVEAQMSVGTDMLPVQVPNGFDDRTCKSVLGKMHSVISKDDNRDDGAINSIIIGSVSHDHCQKQVDSYFDLHLTGKVKLFILYSSQKLSLSKVV